MDFSQHRESDVTSDLRSKIVESKNYDLLRAFDLFLKIPNCPYFEKAYVLIEFPLSRNWISDNSDLDLRFYGVHDIASAISHLSEVQLKYHFLENTDADIFPEVSLAHSRHVAKIENGIFLEIGAGGFTEVQHPYATKPLPLSDEVYRFIDAAYERELTMQGKNLSDFEKVDIYHDSMLSFCLEGRLGLPKPKWRSRAVAELGHNYYLERVSACAESILISLDTVTELEQKLSAIQSDSRNVRWARWYALDCLKDYRSARIRGDYSTAVLCLSEAMKQSIACFESDFSFNNFGDAHHRILDILSH